MLLFGRKMTHTAFWTLMAASGLLCLPSWRAARAERSGDCVCGKTRLVLTIGTTGKTITGPQCSGPVHMLTLSLSLFLELEVELWLIKLCIKKKKNVNPQVHGMQSRGFFQYWQGKAFESFFFSPIWLSNHSVVCPWHRITHLISWSALIVYF